MVLKNHIKNTIDSPTFQGGVGVVYNQNVFNMIFQYHFSDRKLLINDITRCAKRHSDKHTGYLCVRILKGILKRQYRI